jgi:hypothetical protein
VPLERAVEIRKGTRQKAPGTIRRDPEPDGDLGAGEALAGGEDENLALDRTKPGSGALDPLERRRWTIVRHGTGLLETPRHGLGAAGTPGGDPFRRLGRQQSQADSGERLHVPLDDPCGRF